MSSGTAPCQPTTPKVELKHCGLITYYISLHIYELLQQLNENSTENNKHNAENNKHKTEYSKHNTEYNTHNTENSKHNTENNNTGNITMNTLLKGGGGHLPFCQLLYATMS